MLQIITLLFILLSARISSFSQTYTKIVRMEAVDDFPSLTREGIASNRKPYAPFHIESELNALAGDDLNFTFHMAAAEGVFPGNAGRYTIRLNTLTERDGECVYNVYVNDEPVGLFQQNPPTNEFSAPAMLEWTGVQVADQATIRVESNNWSNLLRHEGNFYEYARGRWTGVDFIPEAFVTKESVGNSDLGIFEKIEAVGSDEISYQARYNKIEKAYYLAIAGEKTGNDRDHYGFLSKATNTNFVLEALVTPLLFDNNKGLEEGLMIRQSSASDAPFVACMKQGNGMVALLYRNDPDSPEKKILFNITGADMIQIAKKGNTYTMSAAKFGEDYERKSIELTGLTGPLQAGFYTRSNQPWKREIVRFSRVRYFEDLSNEIDH